MFWNYFLWKNKCTFWKVVLVSSGPLGWRRSAPVLPKGHSPSPGLLLQEGLPVSCTICSGNKVHQRLCFLPLGAASCLLC